MVVQLILVDVTDWRQFEKLGREWKRHMIKKKANKAHQSMAWSEELDRLRVVVTCDEKESQMLGKAGICTCRLSIVKN